MMGAMAAEAVGISRAGAATGVTAAFWQLGSVIVPAVVGIAFQATNSFLRERACPKEDHADAHTARTRSSQAHGSLMNQVQNEHDKK